MLRPAIHSNIMIKVIENFLKKFDIELNENYKTMLSVLIPGLIYRDGSIIIMSATINQLNKIIKKKRDDVNFVSLLLGFDIITHIDIYGTITIPIAVLLNRITVNKETIALNGKHILRKRVLNNAISTLAVAEVLKRLNIPKELSIPIVSVILDLFDNDVNEEAKMMNASCIGFVNHKFSENKKILWKMEIERMFLNAIILSVINYIGLNMGSSIILVNIISEVVKQIQCEYRMKTCKGFLK